ncbi:MAG: hypothetical protein GY796_25475 [Chloroflexi bacterium]|nr:hypothetical protein [Chloroflexota bacterium]
MFACKVAICWLALFLAGIFAYTFSKGIWLTFLLGTPWQDWQWYLPLTLLFVLPLLQVAIRWHGKRFSRLFYLVLFLWILVGFTGFGYEESISLSEAPPIKLSFWVGRIEGDDTRLLEQLQAAEASLYLRGPTPLTDERSQAFSVLLEQLNGYDIGVLLFVPASDFLSVPVQEEWMENIGQTAAFIQQENPPNIRGLIGDAEAPRFTPFDSFRSDISPVTAAAIEMESFLSDYQQAYPDLPIGVTAAWQLHLDKLDGDQDLSILYRAPVDPPDSWNFASVMNYSSYYPSSMRPYLVSRTIHNMAYRYPDKLVSHLIGLVGGGFLWEPILDFEDIVQDGRIARALGAEEIVVFQLKGAVEDFGEDFVLRFATAVNNPPTEEPIHIPFSRLASLWLTFFALLDAFLDLVGFCWQLTIVWMGISLILVLLHSKVGCKSG